MASDHVPLPFGSTAGKKQTSEYDIPCLQPSNFLVLQTDRNFIDDLIDTTVDEARKISVQPNLQYIYGYQVSFLEKATAFDVDGQVSKTLEYLLFCNGSAGIEASDQNSASEDPFENSETTVDPVVTLQNQAASDNITVQITITNASVMSSDNVTTAAATATTTNETTIRVIEITTIGYTTTINVTALDATTYLEITTNVTATANDNHTALSNRSDTLTTTTTTTSYDETTISFNTTTTATTENVTETNSYSTTGTGTDVSVMCSGNSTMNETTNSTGK